MEKWKEAEEDASQSIEMGNDSWRKYDRRGQARYNLGNYEGALEDFIRAKALDPDTKSVDQNIEFCEQKLKRRQIEKEKKEENQKKSKDEIPAEVLPVAADEGEVQEKTQHNDEHQSRSTSDSEDERYRKSSLQNNKVNENTEAGDSKTKARKTDDIKISPLNSGQSRNEKTGKELRLEIEADKKELQRLLQQAKLDQNAKKGMIELIREKILEEERLKLIQEKLALRDMVERYKEEERRKNCEKLDQGTDPDSAIGLTPDYFEVL